MTLLFDGQAQLARSRAALTVFATTLALACTPQGDPAVGSAGLSDDFERSSVGELWKNTGGPWEIREGALHVRGARNRPLWLRRVLPRDVRIEFTAKSMSEEGDIKFEIFGDGVSRAEGERYTATSYVVIMGGWDNSSNIIARLNEHGADRVVGRRQRVELGREYQFKVERVGSVITVFVDGEELVKMDDPHALEGRGHDHFAFNNWESDLWFDNLVITPL